MSTTPLPAIVFLGVAMESINKESIVDLVFQLKWSSGLAAHTETYAATAANIWRDCLPGALHEALLGRQCGDRFSLAFKPGELINGAAQANELTLSRRQFDSSRMTEGDPHSASGSHPRKGRFYPRGLLKEVAGIFPQNLQPFRCTEVDTDSFTASLEHPLRQTRLALDVSVGSVREKTYERGGTSTCWIDLLTAGAGMQARWRETPTDFYRGAPFGRADETEDARFYRRPRLVDHIDQTAREMLSNFYTRFVADELRILDLMSSWRSHLPYGLRPRGVAGVGLNAEELGRNPALTQAVVQDLNASPQLPFSDGSFDLALCALSVEYLTDPIRLFEEVARVLVPGGGFVVSFSNRWFPTKAIRLWSCLHEFERMGLVLDYFAQSGRFVDLGTYSMRGLPRPSNDRYTREQPYSDPLYVVWGYRRF
jgi:hypothetical protein